MSTSQFSLPTTHGTESNSAFSTPPSATPTPTSTSSGNVSFSSPPALTTPTPTQSSSDNLNVPSTSGTLYLYTFLATLVLLLAVSSAIVIRSLVLRRRHQRAVALAIANGTWVPSPNGRAGRKKRDIGEKPAMFDAWVVRDGETEADGNIHSLSGMQPLTIAYVNASDNSPMPDAKLPSEAQPAHRSVLSAILPWRYPVPPVLPTTSTTASSSSPPASTSTDAEKAEEAEGPHDVRMAFLISMPFSSVPQREAAEARAREGHEEDGEAPVVELGVIEAEVKKAGEGDGANDV